MSPRFHLTIIGAGLCGLSAAISTRLEDHDVTLLESARTLRDRRMPRNYPQRRTTVSPMGRIQSIAQRTAVPSALSIHRWDGTVLLTHEDGFQEKVVERYGAPFWGLNPVDLQRTLAGRAQELGVVLRLSSRAVHIDFNRPCVALELGETISRDVVLGVDRLWFTSRDISSLAPFPRDRQEV